MTAHPAHRHPHGDPLRLTAIASRIVLAALAAAPAGAEEYIFNFRGHSAEGAVAVAAAVSGDLIECSECLFEVLCGAVAMMSDYIHDADPERYEAALDDVTRTAAGLLDAAEVTR